jgi:hypothetical protein
MDQQSSSSPSINNSDDIQIDGLMELNEMMPLTQQQPECAKKGRRCFRHCYRDHAHIMPVFFSIGLIAGLVLLIAGAYSKTIWAITIGTILLLLITCSLVSCLFTTIKNGGHGGGG